MAKFTLTDMRYHAAQGIASHVGRIDNAWLFWGCFRYWEKRKLTFDTATGITSATGQRNLAQFVGFDWGKSYEDAPHLIFWDAFGPIISNSMDRRKRGLDFSGV